MVSKDYFISGQDWSTIQEDNWKKFFREKIDFNNQEEIVSEENILNVSEDSNKQEPEDERLLRELYKYFPRKDSLYGVKLSPYNLGVYFKKNSDDTYRLCTSQYVGIMPVLEMFSQKPEKGKYISIRSRFHISPIEMLNEVLNGMDYYEHPEMLTFREYTPSELKHINDEKVLFGIVKGVGKVKISSNERQEKLSGSEDKYAVMGSILSVFEVIRFVSCAKEVCKKNLKKQSTAKEENLNGKVKGRILINKQIKYNLSKGQYHKTYCSYNAMSENIVENCILKYVLHMCSKMPIAEALNEDISFCNRVLANVPLRKCTAADFIGLKTNGAFRQYREALDMAKRILEKFYLTYERKDEINGAEEKVCMIAGEKLTDPYFLDMNLLFEYYCRALFRKAIDCYNEGLDNKLYMEKALLKDQRKRLFGDAANSVDKYFMKEYVPDILIKYKHENAEKCFAVIDAKYSNVEEQEKRERTHQILFYMNVLNCPIGGLIGFEKNDKNVVERKPIIGSYLFDEKRASERKLCFVPLFIPEERNENNVDNTQNGGKKQTLSETYVEDIKAYLDEMQKVCDERNLKDAKLQMIENLFEKINGSLKTVTKNDITREYLMKEISTKEKRESIFGELLDEMAKVIKGNGGREDNEY